MDRLSTKVGLGTGILFSASEKLTLDREVFAKFREVFANFSRFSGVFERVWTRSHAFGRVRMHFGAIEGVWTLPEIFGFFGFVWTILLVFGRF